MTKTPPYIVVVLDESGSMTPQWKSAPADINKYIESIRHELPKGTNVLIRTFNSHGHRTLRQCKLSKMKRIDAEEYKPNGLTPLYDAVAKAIEEVPKEATKVFVVVETDGQENYSTDYGRKQIKELVQKKKDDGWMFVFIGTGDLDAQAREVAVQGGKLGMVVNSVSHVKKASLYASVISGQTMSYMDGSFQPDAEYENKSTSADET